MCDRKHKLRNTAPKIKITWNEQSPKKQISAVANSGWDKLPSPKKVLCCCFYEYEYHVHNFHRDSCKWKPSNEFCFWYLLSTTRTNLNVILQIASHKPVKVYLDCMVWLRFNHPLAVEGVFVKGGPAGRQQNTGGGSEMASTWSCRKINTRSHKGRENDFFFLPPHHRPGMSTSHEHCKFVRMIFSLLQLCKPFLSR